MTSTGGLQPARKQVGDSVAGDAVTQPTDPALKKADIDRKMRLYGVVEALRQGNYPDNKQCDRALSYTLKNSPIDESKLSPEGKGLVEDFKAIIETARQILVQKNSDELAQNFLFHTRQVEITNGSVNSPVNKSEAQAHGDQATEHLRTLGKLIFTNAEFRKLLKDCSFIGRDILADGAAKVADHARPAEHQLAQVDEPAPDDRWLGPDGQIHGVNDPAPDTSLGAKRDQARKAKSKVDGAKESTKLAAADTVQAANEAIQSAPDSTRGLSSAQSGAVQSTLKDKTQQHVPNQYQQVAQGTVDDAKHRIGTAVDSAPGTTSYDDVQMGRVGNVQDLAQGGTGGLNGLSSQEREAAKVEGKATLKDRAFGAIPDQHRERVLNQLNRGQDYLKDKVPEERRQRFIYRLKKVVVEQQRHRDYQDAIEFFLDIAETYHGHAKTVASQTSDKAGAVLNEDNSFKLAETELRTLLERFANGQSMQPIFNAINVIYEDANKDEELKTWFHELDQYIRRVLQEPGYVMKDACDEEGNRLQRSGKGFFSERYRPHRQNLFNTIGNFFQSFADDPLNKRFGEEWKVLTKHLLLDGDGSFKYKPHLWTDVRSVILPALATHIGYIPIPRIEYTDPTIDLVVENLTLESQNMLPNIFEIEARNYFKLSAYSAIADKSKHSMWVRFSQVQADLRDVAFYFNKKSGFPKMKDHGLADVFIGGNGISGKVHLESNESRGSVFTVRGIKVKVDSLKFKIRDSNHQLLYSTLRPLATSLIKKQIAKAIQDAIRSGLGALDAQLVEIRDRMDEADQSEDGSKIGVLKDSFSSKKVQAEETKEKTGTFKLVTKRDSKINAWSSPDSIVEKQGERADQAMQGHEWRSSAFDIV